MIVESPRPHFTAETGRLREQRQHLRRYQESRQGSQCPMEGRRGYEAGSRPIATLFQNKNR